MTEPQPARQEPALSPSPLVVLRDVHKSYADGASEVQVLRGVDLEVAAGEMLVIRGASGAGKSTLLNLIGGIDRASRGSVAVAGQSLGELGGRALTAFRRHSVGFVFQAHNLLPTLTAHENVMLGLEAMRVPRAEAAARASRALAQVWLGEKAGSFPDQLSGGQRQRVAIARALAKEAPLVLADEPTGTLDEETAQSVLELLLRIRALAGTTLVLVTHDPAVGALADRTLLLTGGRLRAPGGAGAAGAA